jgi:hypothetical protein
MYLTGRILWSISAMHLMNRVVMLNAVKRLGAVR